MGKVGSMNRAGHSQRIAFITQDPSMLNLLQMADKIALTDVAVLIQGESGTGKELVAKRIHERSARATKPIVSLNCGAIQENLLLSELFGHEKGAFTGALFQRKGLVEVAHGGTLFLDEIGEMGMEAQAKLLRFLQEGEIYRVGGKSPIRVHARIISATNKDLESQVKSGKFREDLFYRVNNVTLRMIALRKRPGDIALLLEKFLKEGNLVSNTAREITPRALALLQKYSWPGNVRELQNTVERFKILVENDVITENDIPANIKSPGTEVEDLEEPTSFLLEQVEKRHILKVLHHFKGNKTKAAGAMGITVKTLYNKLTQYEQDRNQEDSA
jgi:transcriptional regulator with PAS, ATPase and Fis domain